MPFSRVKEFHIAGHKKENDVIIDTHGAEISQDVYDLYAIALQYAPATPILIERDNNTPPLASLISEIDQLKVIYYENLSKQS